jgi:hypothetical protein
MQKLSMRIGFAAGAKNTVQDGRFGPVWIGDAND